MRNKICSRKIFTFYVDIFLSKQEQFLWKKPRQKQKKYSQKLWKNKIETTKIRNQQNLWKKV